jgi:hypothetical protein
LFERAIVLKEVSMGKRFTVLIAMVCLLGPGMVFAADYPDLKGTWSGPSMGIRIGDDPVPHKDPKAAGKVSPVEMTLIIESQEKGVFQGKHKSKRNEERIIGVICSEGKTLFMVDEDSYFTGKIVSKDKLEVVWMEVHPGKSHGIARTVYTKKK